VNDGGAQAKDALELIRLVQAKAKAERSIDLQPEVEVIGE
jgi:UDP-N-acetylenolpyruvoylglucosamine reductase